LSNEAMPGLIKIGQSAADPDNRAVELDTTGVPASFFVEYKGLFPDYARLERLVHLHLAEYRYRQTREFFRISPLEGIEAIKAVATAAAKYEEIARESEWKDEGQGYCRRCGVVVSLSSTQCLRCGAPDPAK